MFYSQAGTLRSQVQALDLAGRIIFTGFLPDDEVVVLLNRATALVLPSLMEGFGLPALEAAACGCPVVATTASPLPDVLGEGGNYRPSVARTARAGPPGCPLVRAASGQDERQRAWKPPAG